jgi:TonB family protein
MIRRRSIVTDQGCLTQEAIEAYIEGDLTAQEKELISAHAGSCELCSDALEGALHFKNAATYSAAVEAVRSGWKKKKTDAPYSDRSALALMLTAAASVAVIISIIALSRHQKNIRLELLSQITEQGTSLDEVISASQIKVHRYSESPITVTDEQETSARKTYQESEQMLESTLPVAEIEKTVIYPGTGGMPSNETSAENAGNRQHEPRQLRSPFRVMSHPPVSIHPNLPDEQPVKDDIFVAVEDMPRFQGGDIRDFRSYIMTNIRYPHLALEKNISGRVYVQFVINKNGDLTNARIIQSDHPVLEKEVLRVIEKSPKWMPGKQRGKPVDVSLIMPVDFVLKR